MDFTDIAEIFEKHRQLQKIINAELGKVRETLVSPNPYQLTEVDNVDHPMLHVTATAGHTSLMDYAAGRMKPLGGADNSTLVELKTIRRAPRIELGAEGYGNWLEARLLELIRDLEVWHLNTIMRLHSFTATLSARFHTDKDGETLYQNSRLLMTAEFYAYTWVKK